MSELYRTAVWFNGRMYSVWAEIDSRDTVFGNISFKNVLHVEEQDGQMKITFLPVPVPSVEQYVNRKGYSFKLIGEPVKVSQKEIAKVLGRKL
jgi:hypothetical protein